MAAPGRNFLVAALAFALVLAVVGNLALAAVGGETNAYVALGTAVVVGMFMALVLLGRRKKASAGESDGPGETGERALMPGEKSGFDVEDAPPGEKGGDPGEGR